MSQPKKIILIVIDTLRADHLGCYGYKRDTSPFIDEFAKECVFFEHAISPGSQTLPVHASMFTSKYIVHHSAGYNNEGRLDSDKDITLAEIMQSLGYETAGFVSVWVLRKSTGINSGFNYYDDEMTLSHSRIHGGDDDPLIRGGFDTSERALNWIKEHKDKQFFLFVHFFDIHAPYLHPAPYNSIFCGDDYYGEEKILDMAPYYSPIGGIPEGNALKAVKDKEGRIISYEHDARYYVSQYDGGIRYEDQIVSDFIEKLKELGVYDESLIILTSDHGEAMGENDAYFEHGLTVTLDQIHVPLMIKPDNGRHAGIGKIEAPVSTIDIMPTILSLCGYGYQDLCLDGKILTNAANQDTSFRILLSETYTQYARTYPNKTLVLNNRYIYNVGNNSANERIANAKVKNMLQSLENRVYSLGKENLGIEGRILCDNSSPYDRSFSLEQTLVQRNDEILSLSRRSERQQEQLTDNIEKAVALETSISQRDGLIKALNERVSSLEHNLSEKETSISQRDGLIKALNERVSSLEHNLYEKETSISQRDGLIKALNERVSSLEHNLSAKDVQLCVANEKVVSLEKTVAEIKKSGLWILTQKLDGAILPLMPYGSRRRGAYNRMVLAFRNLVKKK